MTAEHKFRADFLEYCADHGVGPEEAVAVVKQARVFLSKLCEEPEAGPPLRKAAAGKFLESVLSRLGAMPMDITSRVTPGLLTLGATAAIAAPIAGGLAAGHAVGAAQDDDINIDEARTRELVAEYQRWTEQAKRHSQLRALRDQV